MDAKRDAYMERTFDGASAMWLRKSAQEAPEVGTYNYENVDIQAYDGGTELRDFNSQWSTTLYGEQISSKHRKSEAATVDVDTLLNDAWFCVMIEDHQKLQAMLERTRVYGIPYPADHPIKNMFGVSTLWSRIHDPDFRIPGSGRDAIIRVMQPYHA